MSQFLYNAVTAFVVMFLVLGSLFCVMVGAFSLGMYVFGDAGSGFLVSVATTASIVFAIIIALQKRVERNR